MTEKKAAKPKAAPKKAKAEQEQRFTTPDDLFKHLLGLKSEIEAFYPDVTDRVRTPLLNIVGELSHLRDAITTDESLLRV